MSLDPEIYNRQAEAAYQIGFELLKSARAAQIEYGRWLVNTLWLMHSGAIVGLVFKAHGGEHPPSYSGALFWFVAGIVSAFIAAFAAWWNFTFAAVLFHSWADVTHRLVIDTAAARGSAGVRFESLCCEPLLLPPYPSTKWSRAISGRD